MNTRERLKSFLASINVSEGSFEKETGLAKGFVSKVGDSIRISSLEKIKSIYPGLNTAWLLTGEGEMLVKPSIEHDAVLPQKEPIPNDVNYKLVPVVHIDSVGGVHSNNEVSQSEPQYIEGYVPFVNAQEGDRAIFQTGNSMIPTCPPGCLLLIREVPKWREYFGYGNIFVIELSDGRRITKEVSRYEANPRDYVWCISHNPSVPDEELPKSMIVSVWKVIKILTDKGW